MASVVPGTASTFNLFQHSHRDIFFFARAGLWWSVLAEISWPVGLTPTTVPLWGEGFKMQLFVISYWKTTRSHCILSGAERMHSCTKQEASIKASEWSRGQSCLPSENQRIVQGQTIEGRSLFRDRKEKHITREKKDREWNTEGRI